AGLSSPQGIAVSANGDLYFADLGNQRIRRVDGATGIISTVVGTGNRGYNGDGIPAVRADLSDPNDVKLDASGNILIADTHNQRVRRLDLSTGLISTIAGNGTSGFSGDGGPATLARLATPLALAVDAMGNLYISDASNNRIRRVSSGGTITTVAGNGFIGSS